MYKLVWTDKAFNMHQVCHPKLETLEQLYRLLVSVGVASIWEIRDGLEIAVK